MSKLVWDEAGERFYETGVKNVVLFPKTADDGGYATGVAWNGITAISEKPSGAEATALYADNIKYLNLLSNEEFAATIEAYTYPDEFGVCDGSIALTSGVIINQQSRKQFGLCYRTEVGNDEDGLGKHFKLHFVYNCLAAPSERSNNTINDSPEAMTFSWEVTTTPEEIGDTYKPTAHIVVDSAKADSTKLQSLLDMVYGKDASGSSTTGSDPTLPSIGQIISTLA